MAQELCPAGLQDTSVSGIKSLKTSVFDLECLYTVTGVKFFVLASPGCEALPTILVQIYRIYSDYVLKNPFYVLDNVIQAEKFTNKLLEYVNDLSSSNSSVSNQ